MQTLSKKPAPLLLLIVTLLALPLCSKAFTINPTVLLGGSRSSVARRRNKIISRSTTSDKDLDIKLEKGSETTTFQDLEMENMLMQQDPELLKGKGGFWKEENPKEITMMNKDCGLVTKDEVKADVALHRLASEIGVKEFVGALSANSSLAGVPVDVLTERAMDTVEDIWQHLRRIPYEKGIKSLSPEEDQTRKTVVILGSGWAAHALMKVADCNKLRIIVVSPSNHFVFTPMLASAAVGTVEYRSMTEAVRSANPMIHEYVEGKAIDVNVQDKKVKVQLNSLLQGVREGTPPILDLDYDHLVVSVGCRVDDKGVPGANKALRLKSCDDARRLRRAVGECFEYASRPDVAGEDKIDERTKRATFLIVGGGATGVELTGELRDLVADITRPLKGAYPKMNGHVRVILVHSGSDLVPQFEQNLRDEALKALKKEGVEVILNTRVTEVSDGSVQVSTKVFDEASGKVIGREESALSVGLTIWCAGTAPVPFVDKLLDQLPVSARNRDGRIKVDKWLRPIMKDGSELGSVLVLGDAAAFPDKEMVGADSLLPQTAQVAGQQGAYIARMLSRGYDLESPLPMLPSEPSAGDGSSVFRDPSLREWLEVRDMHVASKFKFLNLGLLAYLGGGEALSQVQVGDVPIFKYGGSVAFILWRSVYLVKQVATKNRVLITFDWIKSAIFGRDMTRL